MPDSNGFESPRQDFAPKVENGFLMLPNRSRNIGFKRLGLVLVAVIVFGVAPSSPAQTPSTEEQTLKTLQSLQKRLDQLEKQNQDLQDTVRKLNDSPRPTVIAEPTSQATPASPLPPGDVRSVVNDVLKERDKAKAESEAAAKKKAEDEGYEVGTNLNLTGRWKNGAFWVETPNKDFTMHIGSRIQYDVVGVSAPNNVIYGTGGLGSLSGGVNAFDDATNFRRARLNFQGSFWEVFNFQVQYDFVNTTQSDGALTITKNPDGTVTNVTAANNTYNTPVPTDLWIEATQLPWIGNIRVGNLKAPIGFEHYTSSAFLNFMERSSMFDSFLENGDNGFETGMMAYNWTENQRATGAIAVTKTTRNVFGWNVGDGEWGVTNRLTYLPYWEENGRCFVHVGLGSQYRGADDQQFRLRARTELRNGPAALHTITAISQVQATEGQLLLQPEFVVQMGPFLLQSEFAYTEIEGVNRIIRTPTQANTNISQRAYRSTGAYVEMLYFLTGEHREYNKKLPGFGRVVPFRNAYWVKNESGTIFSQGAWQVGLRYSYLNQNNAGILGGENESWTLGLNWFLNPNFKIQWNYEIATRDVGTPVNNPNGNGSGTYQGLGVRFAFDF